jgi:hypothetical protein
LPTRKRQAFERTFQCPDVAATGGGEGLQGANHAFGVGAVHVVEGGASETQPPLDFAVRDDLSLFGFSGQDARNRFFVGFLFGSLREPAGELLVADGLPGVEKGQESVDLLRRQTVDDL